MNRRPKLFPFRSMLRSVAVAAIVVFFQCVYFNLFYNAKTSYDTAYTAHYKILKQNPDSIVASLPSEIQSNYERAIDKATRVIDEYPKKKKWHDDAAFLIGKAFFFKGEYEKALHYFKQLREEFPESPFVGESYLFSGRCCLRMENLDKAEEFFNIVLEKYPVLDKDEAITLLLIEVALSREGRSKAVDLLEKSLSRVKSKERKIDLILKTARISIDLKQYDKAVVLLQNCPREKKFPERLFQVDFLLVECFVSKDSLAKAMNFINEMLKNRVYSWHTPDILFKKASVFEKMGDIDNALTTYSSITEVYADGRAPGGASADASVSVNVQKTVTSAWFELGRIYQVGKGNFLKAKECFEKVSSSVDTALHSEAARRMKSIDTLIAFCSRKDTTDTIKSIALRNILDFKIGELFWLELNLPDSAYAHFTKLAVRSDSLRPKSLYCAAYIARHGLLDTIRSDSLFNVLIKEFFSNEYAKMAQKERGEKITVHTRQDSAIDGYLKAESLFVNLRSVEEAVEAFKTVYFRYPDCELGQKALYAAGWISDNILNNNKTAFRLFQMFCDSFPKSEAYVNEIKPRLKAVSDTLAARKTRGKTGAPSSAAQAGEKTDKTAKQPSAASAASGRSQEKPVEKAAKFVAPSGGSMADSGSQRKQ